MVGRQCLIRGAPPDPSEHVAGVAVAVQQLDRADTRAGHYDRKLHTEAGDMTLKVPKLRTLPFETAIIEQYRRRDASVEEALIEMYLAGVSVRRVEDVSPKRCGARG